MYEPNEPDRAPDPSQPEETWEQWFERTHAPGRAGSLRLVVGTAVVVVALIALFLSGNSAIFHR